MALHNINTIQNQKDLAYILESSYNFNYESLANLGQRYSVKGDGIVTQSFKISDLINIPNTNDPNIVKLYINNKKLYLSVFNIENLFTPVNTEEIKYSINNNILTNTPLALNTKINGIDYYKENTLMFLSNQYFYIASLGCVDDIIYELNVECYDVNSNILIESLKLIDTNEATSFENEIENPSYYLYYIKKTNIDDNTDNHYQASEYKINISLIDNIYNDFNTFALSFYSSVILEYFNQYKTLNINDILSEIIQFGFVSTTDNNIIELLRNEEDDNGYIIVSDDFNSNIQLKTIIHYIYNQELIMYMFMFEYYSNFIYKTDNLQLKRYILYKLFETAFSCSGNIENTSFEMFFPINYSIDYYVNDNNTFYIYTNESPINVYFTEQTINTDFINNFFITSSGTSSQMAVCNSINLETVMLFKFVVDYNKSNQNIINNINLSRLYSTPYIQDDYWVINDIKSMVKATGEDGGNPNIIMIYNDGSTPNESDKFDKNPIISSIDDFFLNNALSWEMKTVTVKLFETEYVNLYNNNSKNVKIKTHYNIVTYVPKVDKGSDASEKLKNAFILNLTKFNENTLNIEDNFASTIKNEIINYYGADACVTTFWRYNYLLNEFENVKDPNDTKNSGLTFTQLSNVNSIAFKLSNLVHDINTGKGNAFTNIVITNPYILKNQTNVNNYENAISTVIAHTAYNTAVNTYLVSEQKLNSFNNNSILELYNINNISTYTLTPTPKILNIGAALEKYEYVINDNVPTLSLSEYLTSDIQLLNRVNIISVGQSENNNGKLYYSYFGTSIDDAQKNTLHIGTSKVNPHIGVSYMINKSEATKFTEQEILSIDFNTIKLNSETTYISKNTVKHIYENCYLLETTYSCKIDNNNVNTKIDCTHKLTSDNVLTFTIKGIYLDEDITTLTYYFDGTSTYYGLFELNPFVSYILGDNIVGEYGVYSNASIIDLNATEDGLSRKFICTNISKYNLSSLSNLAYTVYYTNVNVEYNISETDKQIFINFIENDKAIFAIQKEN